MSTAIKVENLSKEYRLGSISYGMLFRDLQSGWARLRGKEDPNESILAAASQKQDRFLALDRVSFEIKQGDVVGIIGKNGAGKSTLLKILSRVTTPTAGRVSIRGRIASLLEVGTGFHPELSGRENIFLNGAILGMSRSEVQRKFDEIVDFSGVERFIDTPVKRYSSGMYVRLAFAVAANLEPEILIVDEVLAVGDSEFQKKCLGKMQDVSRREGRTVLFVSHNMGAVSELCSTGIFLDHGKKIFQGRTHEAIAKYSTKVGQYSVSGVELKPKENLVAQVLNMWLEDYSQTKISEIKMGQRTYLGFAYQIRKPVRDLVIALQISRNTVPILYSYDSDLKPGLRGNRDPGDYRANIALPTEMFKEGEYTFQLMIGHGQDNITDPDAYISANLVNFDRDFTHHSCREDRPGFLFQELNWEVKKA